MSAVTKDRDHVEEPRAETPKVLELRRRDRERLGDPVADYVAIWTALEVFHDNCRLTEEGWSFLSEQLQRPIELRLLERTPTSLLGAHKALGMASYIMDNLEQGGGQEEDGAWYRRLRTHLVTGARDLLREHVEHKDARKTARGTEGEER